MIINIKSHLHINYKIMKLIYILKKKKKKNRFKFIVVRLIKLF